MAIPKAFWAEEAKEPAHKSIKNALLAAGETKMHHSKKKHHKKTERHKKVAEHKSSVPKTKAAKTKIHKAMHDFKIGNMHAGKKSGPVVKNRKQAIAIALSQGRKAK